MLNKLFKGTQTMFHSFRSGYQKKIFSKPKKGSRELAEYNSQVNFNVKARKQLQNMQKNIEVNTPRIAGGLILAVSIPQFYYFYQAMWQSYSDRSFFQNIKKSVDWINLKNTFTLSILFGLEVVKFKDRKAKNVSFQKGGAYRILLIPLFLHFLSLSYFDKVDKRFLGGTFIGTMGVMFTEAKFTNSVIINIEIWRDEMGFKIIYIDLFEGIIQNIAQQYVFQGLYPFWMFNLKYQMHIFDVLFIICMYYAVKRLKVDIDKNSHRYFESYSNELEQSVQ